MTKIRAIIEKHALSMHDLGVKMGYPEQSARKSVWQLLKSADPRISMLRRFAKAMGINVKELL
jgi:hypothetical protein